MEEDGIDNGVDEDVAEFAVIVRGARSEVGIDVLQYENPDVVSPQTEIFQVMVNPAPHSRPHV